METAIHRVIRAFAAVVVRFRLDLTVEGLEHLPRSGPTVVAARHYHHLYDACVLLTVIRRPVHFFVALDWLGSALLRRVLEAACAWARWPVALRTERLDEPSGSVYQPSDATPYIRNAVQDGLNLLLEGRLLVIFPEAYPNVDPMGTPKQDRAFLPFRPGFAALAVRAEQESDEPVLIVPAGLSYHPGPRWRVRLRFGLPVARPSAHDRQALVEEVERAVRELSRPEAAAST